MCNILKKKELNTEIHNYQLVLHSIKKYNIIFLSFTIIMLIVNSLCLFSIYDDWRWENFIIAIWVAVGLLGFTTPIILIWYIRRHTIIRSHFPVLFQSKIIDWCVILMGLFNYICAVIAASMPLIVIESENKIDLYVLIYIATSAFFYLIWAILFPIIQESIEEKINNTFSKYMRYDYDKITEYVKYLNSIFLKRKNEFNKSLPNKKKKLSVRLFPWINDKILYTPVTNSFISYDSRRIFNGKYSKYGDEYYLFKFCVFIQMFEELNKEYKNKMHNHVINFLHIKDKDVARKFNKKIKVYKY